MNMIKNIQKRLIIVVAMINILMDCVLQKMNVNFHNERKRNYCQNMV